MFGRNFSTTIPRKLSIVSFSRLRPPSASPAAAALPPNSVVSSRSRNFWASISRPDSTSRPDLFLLRLGEQDTGAA